MGSSPQHPLESVHRARDALQQATTAQAHADPARQDLPAYGSALLGTLSALGGLTRVLADQLEQIDRERVRREALRDHPHEAVEHAIEHLNNLRRVLNMAVADAENYWSTVEHFWADTESPPEDRD
ncbi:hypothetical protein DFQ14_102554 [Halopolyspora algeriensis]|uniref:Excreted virulence factor EspC (Type VII ESX diderm) n=1 Tax=Halopolyspora algeriensis TaxID=1500506 RepID=A0A368W0Y2_9ACTN|nr:hypothetical protein [Halopolyspora algeriensis]RCW46251.1 hypothetical protein DFQ14_102554 [Halopolyspora algeriensis]TQM55654.1 hypothetical protein FHU43_0429 [Halopolyspora algeriensis]